MFLFSLFSFVLTISFLVAIHEYGHFWVARKFGVKIEKFSIGFGKPIIKWYGKRDNTEYSISWIPLGGYVKMYGENPSDRQNVENTDSLSSNQTHDVSDITDIVSNDSAGSFSALPPIKRFLIAFAGPAVNLIFAVLALWFLYVLGVPALKPYVGTVEPNSIFAKAHINRGAEIIAIDNKESRTITDTVMHLVDYIGQKHILITIADKNGIKQTTNINLTGLPSGSELQINKALGFEWEIAQATDDLSAKLKEVVPNSPADKAGLQVADVITSANGRAIKNWQAFVEVIHNNVNQKVSVTVNRHGSEKVLTLIPESNPNNQAIGFAGIAPEIPTDLFEKYRTVKRYGFLKALPMAIKGNYLQAKLTLKTLGRIIIGSASVKNIGGPISIADISGQTLKAGYVAFLQFLAAISLTLAVMNLLPIPVLDGGHMLLCTIEMVRGKPVSEKTGDLLLRIGLSVMLTFMLVVITVDFWKYLFS